jgi:hypothetical protein
MALRIEGSIYFAQRLRLFLTQKFDQMRGAMMRSAQEDESPACNGSNNGHQSSYCLLPLNRVPVNKSAL